MAGPAPNRLPESPLSRRLITGDHGLHSMARIHILFLGGNFPSSILLKRDRDPKTIELALNASANNPARVPLFAWSGLQRRSDFYAIVAERLYAEYLRLADHVCRKLSRILIK